MIFDLFHSYLFFSQASVPATVYGDIHGQYSDLLRWLNLNGFPNETRCVFLGRTKNTECRDQRSTFPGDFVDRGPHGVEVIMIIVLMKVDQRSDLKSIDNCS